MAEKCNNPTPGDLSTVHVGEKRVQTVLWMQKASDHQHSLRSDRIIQRERDWA